ncbi:MAG: BatA domain-containing protein [Gammaproteobacteria bacterium]|nr:BatA domain-containing protein [Gammaproteobacteria bacterium]
MSLLAGAFLAGLAVLAVPLLLHRLKERSPAETTVSSLMLMREAEEPARTRTALAHRVLLALRLALLAAITLAFAKPVVETVSGASIEDELPPADLVVLDVSLSMRRSSTWSEALDVVRDLRGNDPRGEGRLVLASDRLTAVSALVDAEPGWSRLDFAGLPQRIEAALAAWPTPPGGWRIHIVSDFQATAAPERFNALVEGIQWPVELHVVGGHSANWAVAADTIPAAAVGQSAQTGPDVARIEAVVTSFAADSRQIASPARRLAVSLHRDGEEVDRAAIAVAAGGRTPVAFDVPAMAEETVAWEVRIDADDALPADDVARVVQSARDGRRVAVLAPRAEDSGMRFLLAALDASGFAKPTLLDTDSVWRPADVDCLILVDPGSLPTSTERRLTRYTDAGGGVLTIVGPRTQRARLLPFGGEVGASPFSASLQVVVRDVGHPLAAGGWGGVTVDRALILPTGYGQTILSLVPRARDGAELGGVPMLTEQRLGAGRMVTLLTALDRQWSTLVLQPAFVGFVANVVDYLAGEFARAGHAGEPLPVTSGNVQLFDAQGVRVLALGDTTGGSGNVLRVAEPGLYSVRTPGKETLLAVNVDPRESDLAPMSADLVERWRSAAQRGGSALTRPAVEAATAKATGTPLAPMLLALGLALLIVESAAANVGRVRPRAWMGRA